MLTSLPEKTFKEQYSIWLSLYLACRTAWIVQQITPMGSECAGIWSWMYDAVFRLVLWLMLRDPHLGYRFQIKEVCQANQISGYDEEYALSFLTGRTLSFACHVFIQMCLEKHSSMRLNFSYRFFNYGEIDFMLLAAFQKWWRISFDVLWTMSPGQSMSCFLLA